MGTRESLRQVSIPLRRTLNKMSRDLKRKSWMKAKSIARGSSSAVPSYFRLSWFLPILLVSLICSASYVKCAPGILAPSSEPGAEEEAFSPLQRKASLENLIADEIIQKYLNSEVLPSIYTKNVQSDQRMLKDAAAKRFSEFVGKRFSEFVGKRNPEEKRFSEFVGKRSPEEKRFSEFVGKRSPLDKRFSEFVGKRFSELVGKRSGDNDEKRFSEFVGK